MKKSFLIESSLCRLSLCRTNLNSPLLKSIHFNPETGESRQKRADRRKNIFSVLSVIIPEIELDTFIWGRWYTNHTNETDLYSRGVDYLVSKTGLSYRTIVRVFEDLTKFGYMTSKRRESIGKDGKIIRHFSLRALTRKFFLQLGFKNSTIEETIAWKRKKNEKNFYSNKISKSIKDNVDKLSSIMKTALNKNTQNKKRNSTIIYAKKDDETIKKETNFAKMQQAYDAAKRNGTSPAEEYMKILK